MDVPTLMHNLREEVTCSVCIHLYKEPKQLPCLHIFCLECLNGLARTNARHGKIKCPLCQIEVAVPDSGTMETLPDCFYLKNLLDILAIKECNTSKVTCGNCDKKSDEASYCFHCCKFWCKECLIGHNILREHKEHRVLSLKDFQDEDFEDVIKRPAFCPKELHEKAVFKFYCKVCEVPACQTCVTLEHGKHDVEHLEITARAVRDSIASKLEDAKKSSNTVSSYIRKLEEQSRLLESHSQIIKQQIQETVKTRIQTLQQQERELITEVETQTKEAQEKLMKDKGKLQNRLQKSDQTVSQVTRLLKRSTGAELVRTRTFVDEIFQELHELQEIPSTLERKFPNFVFWRNQEISTLQKVEIGRLYITTTEAKQCSFEGFQEATAGLESQFQVITRNFDGQQCYCPGDNVAVEIVSTQGGKAAAEMKIVDQTDGSYTVSFIPSEAGNHVVTVQVNGENLNEFPRIDIKERSFKPLRFIGEQSSDNKIFNGAWGVTVNNSNEIFVSDIYNNRVLVFTENGEFLRSVGENLLDNPTGISIDNEGRIFVVNRGNNKILLFNSSEKYVRTVNSDEAIKEPRGLSFDSQGNLIICDSGNKCVKFFSPDGIILKTIGKGRLHKPFDCLCYEDKIFVSDEEANLIKVYNNNGRFLYEFGRNGTGDGEIIQPVGLAVDKTGHLLVTDAQRVNVFTFDGTFVKSFGDSSLEEPCGVSVLNDGNIVVADYRKNRLQVFA